jgi:hypothetical protein
MRAAVYRECRRGCVGLRLAQVTVKRGRKSMHEKGDIRRLVNGARKHTAGEDILSYALLGIAKRKLGDGPEALDRGRDEK